MNPALWRRIEQLYHEALEQAPAERAAWLAACSGDEAVRSEVIRLLAANEEAEGFLAQPLTAVAAAEFSDTATRNAATASLLDQTLGHFRIISRIGAGGMGEVYLAKDTSLGRQAALKLLPTAFTADADRLRRFEREARAASALNHPNILTIYEIGVTNDIHFIATEFVEGVTLRQQLADGKPALRATLEVILQVAAALKAAHRAGIVHRDIKPENVMIRPDGLVKVLDFGLAQVTAQTTERQAGVDSDAPTAALLRTAPGMVMGTPRYMSPEQARGQQTDARTDIFSLGVMLYESVTGRPPFAGASLAEIFANLLHQEPEPLTLHAPQAPSELVNVIHQALRKDREERYQTMQDFAAALEQVKRKLEIEAEMVATRQLAVPTDEAIAPETLPQSALVNTAQPSEAKTTVGDLTRNETASASARAAGQRWRGWLLAASFVAIAGGGFALYQTFTRSEGRGRRSEPLNSVPLTTFPGTKDHTDFSPDGSQMVFAWDGINKSLYGKRDIYVKGIKTSNQLQLTTAPADDLQPVWSPKGDYIAFLRQIEGTRYE
ncbi:MAG: protein kinase, partial [Acidobacteria bacterium]|nr:protein kinase [Acidobacteriota bacterium]